MTLKLVRYVLLLPSEYITGHSGKAEAYGQWIKSCSRFMNKRMALPPIIVDSNEKLPTNLIRKYPGL